MCMAPTSEGNRKFVSNPTVIGLGKAMGVVGKNSPAARGENFSQSAPVKTSAPVSAPSNKSSASNAPVSKSPKKTLNIKRRSTVNTGSAGTGLNINS